MSLYYRTIIQNVSTTTTTTIDPLSSDADALSFLNAASISDTNQRSAINTLVISMKNAGIWSKMIAIYPIVGGTAATHKWNLKDPRDLDGAYRLVFTPISSGSWSHNSNGMTPSSAYANTKIMVPGPLTANNTHLSIYSRSNTTGTITDIGCGSGKTAGVFDLNIKQGSNFLTRQYNSGFNISIANPDSLGFYLSTRSPSLKAFKNSTLLGTLANTASISAINKELTIGAMNYVLAGGQNQVLYPSNRQYAFCTVGYGLSDTEALSLYNIIQTYQTSLGRAV